MEATVEDKINYSNAYGKLYSLMNKEVSILRDVLGLLKEIERAILEGNESLILSLSQQRSTLCKKLKIHQKKRTDATKICLSHFKSTSNEKNLTSKLFVEAMSLSDEFGTQTLSLKDQILILIKKIEDQKNQINGLIKHSSFNVVPEHEPFPLEGIEKTYLKTIDPEDLLGQLR